MSSDRPAPGDGWLHDHDDDTGPVPGPPPEPPLWPDESRPYGEYTSPTTPLGDIQAGWPTPPQPTQERRRAPLLPIALLALVLGLGGGAAGAWLFDQAGQDDATGVQTTTVPRVDSRGPAAGGNGSSPVVGVADQVLPSVVSIDVQGTSSEVTGSGFVYDSRRPRRHQQPRHRAGGRMVARSGCSLPDGDEVGATIVGRSPSYDLAVIQLDDAGPVLKPATLGTSDNVEVGQTVVAIGSPLGLNATVTSGIISATASAGHGGRRGRDVLHQRAADRRRDQPRQLRRTVGGPRRFVIGVNSAIATVGGASRTAASRATSASGSRSRSTRSCTRSSEIIETGQAYYPVIGAEVTPVSDIGGAQDRAGRRAAAPPKRRDREGDLVTAINGQPVSDGVQLIVAIRSYEPGDAGHADRQARQRRHPRRY